MQTSISIRDFYQRNQKRLKLSLVSGQVGLQQEISFSNQRGDGIEAVDYLNLIRPPAVVVIGERELNYIDSLASDQRTQLLDFLQNSAVVSIILSHGAAHQDTVIDYFSDSTIPVFSSQLKDPELLNELRNFLNQALARKTTEHGVFIDVHSIGVFITGESGVGKSELALSLISRGHRLISDDITEFSRSSSGMVEGSHPGLSNDFLEVRGLGILNVRAMYGANALRRNKILRMIFNMVHFTPENSHQFDRLGNEQFTRPVLGVEIPQVTLPVAPGRNLAVMVEAAARNHILKMNGYNAAEDFIERQRRAIQANTNE